MSTLSPHTARPVESSPALRFRRHLTETLRLGLPVTFARTGMLVMVMFDTAMTGHFGGGELAFYALAHATTMVLLLAGVGMMTGTAILVAQSRGARQEHECGVIWRVACLHALLFGTLSAVFCAFGGALLPLLGQSRDLSDGAAEAMYMLGLGLPAQLVFVATSLLLEAIGRPRVGLVLMILANAVNAGLNWLLIYGEAGLPAMGAEGAALATTIARWLMAFAIVGYVFWFVDGARYNVRGALSDGWQIGRKFRALGYPLGLAQALESFAFASLTFFAGLIGAEAVAAFQIVMNAVALCYMMAIGLATATAVRVGEAVGRRDSGDTALAGWSGLTAIAAIMTLLGLIMALFPEAIAAVFSDDTRLHAIVVPTLLVAAITLLPDGAQGVLMGALRGTGDAWVPMVLHLCSFTVVMVPAAWLFALGLGLGTPGLMLGTLCGTAVATVLLGVRFRRVSKRTINRL